MALNVNVVVLALNGERVEVESPDPSLTLLSFLRSRTRFTGTKLSCAEGGCGACLVLCASYDPASRRVEQSSINACLALLCSLHCCSITTIEGLSSSSLSAVQQRIAGFHGSQCGFCTPGMSIALSSCLLHNTNTNTNTINNGNPNPNPNPNPSTDASSSSLVTSEDNPLSSGVDNIHPCSIPSSIATNPLVPPPPSNGSAAAGYGKPSGDPDSNSHGSSHGSIIPHTNSGFQYTLPTLSLSDAHKAIVGNICRCTGYRPILDACKSFSAEVDVEDLGINKFWASCKEANLCSLPPLVAPAGGTPSTCTTAPTQPDFPDFLIQELNLRYLHLKELDAPPPLSIRYRETTKGLTIAEERLWIQASSLHHAFEVLQESIQCGGRNRVQLTVGNTSWGYYKDSVPSRVYVDISRIPELLAVQKTPIGLQIGAAVTIEKLIGLLEGMSDTYDSVVTDGLVSHLKKVANPHVRHRASVGGNLIMAQRSCFASDLVPLFLVIDATVKLVASRGEPSIMALEEFMKKGFPEPDMLLESIFLPLSTNWQRLFKSYRAAPRELGNALAFVNAAFLVTVSCRSEGSSERSILDAKIAFGAFGNAHAIRVHAVENYLTGKTIDENVLMEAIRILKDELAVPLKDTKKYAYRHSVAIGLLFEFFLPLLPHVEDDVPVSRIPNVREDAKQPNYGQTFQSSEISMRNSMPNEVLEPGFNISGKQIVPTYEDDDFIGKPIQKTEAAIQASGEAIYVDDIPSPQHCLFAAFVLSTKASAKVKSIDYSLALESPGVVAFISAEDIPKNGKNVGPSPLLPNLPIECLFATEVVEYVGHPLGIVVADSREHAAHGASIVRVEYEVHELPILGIEDAVERDSFFAVPAFLSKELVGDIEKGLLEADHKVTNAEVKTGSQYYFYMETHTALAIPDEDDCMVVYSSSQYPEFLQQCISTCLGIPIHNVRVITRRVGGGFGGKAFRNVTVASACAVAAKRLRYPVRMYLDRKTDILMMGGRHPTKTIYSVGFKSDGRVTSLSAQVFIDAGWSTDISPFILPTLSAGLKKYNWGCMDVDMKVCKTNLCSKSAMRTPGHLQGSFIADTIMEHVAATLGLDVHTVITRNLHTLDSAKLFHPNSIAGGTVGYTLPSMWNGMLKRIECTRKEVTTFNSVSSWRKRGVSVIPCVYGVSQLAKTARVSIFKDGSIVVEVGGIEIGQGLWTKVKQATVFGLSCLCPANSRASEALNVRVVQADTISLPHGGVTASSTTSEGNCEAARRACEVLVERLMPLKRQREQLSSDGYVLWHDLIKSAAESNINLSAQVHWFPEESIGSYLNYGVAATEVELNVLTGAVTILKSDLIYDCGRSLNPAVDIGQIEGAFVQGIGFFLTEEYEVDGDGEVVSNGTWTYKPPSLDNIPRKFLVEITNGAAHSNRILSSKACGEPPLLLAGSVHSAVRRAIEAAREDRFKNSACHNEVLDTRYFELDTPASMEKVKTLCGLDNVETYLKHRITQSAASSRGNL